MTKSNKSTAEKKDYAALNIELGELLAKLQQPGIQVDEALKVYEQGIRLVRQLEAHLEAAENKVEQLKLAAHQAV